jgi:hypothetical protein
VPALWLCFTEAAADWTIAAAFQTPSIAPLPADLRLQVRWQRPPTAGEFVAVGPVQHDFLNTSTSGSSRAADLPDQGPTEDDM